MGFKIEVPRESANEFRDEAKNLAVQAAIQLLTQVQDGTLDLDEAKSSVQLAVEGAIDAVAALADVAIALPEPTEGLSDLALEQGAAALKGLAAGPLAKLIDALDEAIGYNPRRASRRLANLLEKDLEDGVVGDDHAKRVERLARRIMRKSPTLAEELGIELDEDGQLIVMDHTW